MSKYSKLRDHLMLQKADRWQASFAEIEDILGFSLPASAHRHQAWWANGSGPGTHVQAMQWMSAGFEVDSLDLNRKRVVFVRTGIPRPVKPAKTKAKQAKKNN